MEFSTNGCLDSLEPTTLSLYSSPISLSFLSFLILSLSIHLHLLSHLSKGPSHRICTTQDLPVGSVRLPIVSKSTETSLSAQPVGLVNLFGPRRSVEFVLFFPLFLSCISELCIFGVSYLDDNHIWISHLHQMLTGPRPQFPRFPDYYSLSLSSHRHVHSRPKAIRE